MAVKIRLARTGRTHRPFYRIVAIDSKRKRDGKALEIIGSYDPLAGKVLQYNQERVAYWVSNGAIISDAVKKIQHIVKKHGIVEQNTTTSNTTTNV